MKHYTHSRIILTTTLCIALLAGFAACGEVRQQLGIDEPAGTPTGPGPIVEPVAADFTFIKDGISLSVTFVNRTSGDAESFTWNFGNGATSNEANPDEVTYLFPGRYSVSLEASGPGGKDTKVRQVLVP